MRPTLVLAAGLALAAVGCGSGQDTAPTSQPAPAVALPGEPVSGELHTTPSGLQYYILAEGTGPTPAARQRVFVHYTGYLLDGTRFDSSYDRGEPLDFLLGMGEVISGWDEAVGLMSVGSKFKLLIPPDLAYGEAGAGSLVPPNSTLVFDTELMEIR